ncbi:MAG TPA: hypothetical protein VFZ34_18300 [Blastocatellia bacterium]|nr:hypothetical protein [Blastocatellia bacterium]
MSDKDRQKKAGKRQDKANQAMREAEANPVRKAERARQKGAGREASEAEESSPAR